MTTAGETEESQQTPMGKVVDNEPVQISEQDDRKYRHITLENQMQVCRGKESIVVVFRFKSSPMAVATHLPPTAAAATAREPFNCVRKDIQQLPPLQCTRA